MPKPTVEDFKALEALASAAATAHAASSSSTQGADAKLWKNTPLPSIADKSI